jgi:hypothetical protein
MTTAIGAYATLAGVQARNQNTAAGDAAELQVICNQVNMWIESPAGTGRVLAPIPSVTSTLASGIAIGATTVTAALASDIVNLKAGDELAFGPVTGTHESVPVAAVSTATITLAFGTTNAYLTGAPLQRVYLRDGFDACSGDDIVPGRVLIEQRGIVSLSALEIASFTRGAFSLIPATDWFLRPVSQNRDPGYPATEIALTNIPSPTNSIPAFFPGYGNVRMWGVMGWPAVPDDIAGVAERVVVALWQMRSGGGAYQVSPGSDNFEAIPHLLSLDDWRAIKSYRIKTIGIIG